MIDLTAANAFFAIHLESSYWNSLDDANKTACLTMAEGDVLLRLDLDEIDIETTGHLAAVCEQAVYLCHNRDQLSLPSNLASESIEGAGSRAYYNGTTGKIFSPRAAAIIRRITGGGNLISRG